MELENVPSLLAELVEGKALSAGWEGTVGTMLFSDSILPLAWATSGKIVSKLNLHDHDIFAIGARVYSTFK